MEGNSIKSFENLCKIFEMRIKLDKERNIKTPSDVIDNYEKYAKKIDSIYNKEFEKQTLYCFSFSKVQNFFIKHIGRDYTQYFPEKFFSEVISRKYLKNSFENLYK